MDNLILKKLNNISNKLDEAFGKKYKETSYDNIKQIQSPLYPTINNQKSTVIIKETNNFLPIYPLFSYPPSQTVIINNSHKDFTNKNNNER